MLMFDATDVAITNKITKNNNNKFGPNNNVYDLNSKGTQFEYWYLHKIS
jgi:hypothetical protein